MQPEPTKSTFLERPPFWFAGLCYSYPALAWAFFKVCAIAFPYTELKEQLFATLWLISPLPVIVLFSYSRWFRGHILIWLACWNIQCWMFGVNFIMLQKVTADSYHVLFGPVK